MNAVKGTLILSNAILHTPGHSDLIKTFSCLRNASRIINSVRVFPHLSPLIIAMAVPKAEVKWMLILIIVNREDSGKAGNSVEEFCLIRGLRRTFWDTET